MDRLFTPVLVPGGIPSHCRAGDAGLDPRGRRARLRDLARVRSGVRQPDLVVACVVGDGEAETGPLATSWHSNKFLDPVNDGAVLPILHLNGYKIANPTVLARIPEDELDALMRGYGWDPIFVTGDDPAYVHRRSPLPWTPAWTASPRSSSRRAPAGPRSARAGR
jgi:xylulose-5-phosphate/fructose-6-phosphate phosphoketolase